MIKFRRDNICKICGKNVKSNYYIKGAEICIPCGIELEDDIKFWQEEMPYYKEKANNEKDAETKIKYLKKLLDMLYKYKIKYYDKDFEIFEQDVHEQLYSVINALSWVRTECNEDKK